MARAVVRLADGAVTPHNRMGLDLMLVTATQAALPRGAAGAPRPGRRHDTESVGGD